MSIHQSKILENIISTFHAELASQIVDKRLRCRMVVRWKNLSSDFDPVLVKLLEWLFEFCPILGGSESIQNEIVYVKWAIYCAKLNWATGS